MISKIACQMRKPITNHKEDLGCVLRLLLKCHHKTSMVSLEKQNTQHVFYLSLLIKHGKLNKQLKRYAEKVDNRI